MSEVEYVRVYKFYSQRWGLEALSKSRLKVTTLEELNDPFEFASVSYKHPILREVLRSVRKQMWKNKGILSFSKSWHNPIMWSHYADNHRGICLGFDVDDSLMSDVEYKSKRLAKGISFENTAEIETEEFQRMLIVTKYHHWKYEKEARMFFVLDETQQSSGRHFVKFKKIGQLREVILGSGYKPEKRNNRSAWIEKNMCANLITGRLAFTRFSVVEQIDDQFTKTLFEK